MGLDLAVDGGTVRRLTDQPGMATAPHVSPDGKWIAFLLSDDSAYMTGQTVSVSGGLTMV